MGRYGNDTLTMDAVLYVQLIAVNYRFGSGLSQQTYTPRGIISHLSAVCTADFSRNCHFSL